MVFPDRGRGVVAACGLVPGDEVLVFGGPRLRRDQIVDFTHCLEVGRGLFLGPSGEADDFVNHSCDPNCAIAVRRSRVGLEAIRIIEPGEEVTFDYSTAMLTDPTAFVCSCGTARCRGTVKAFRRLPAPLRAEYLRRGLVPRFVTRNGAL